MAEYIEREAAIENAISQMRVSKSELCMRERLMNIPAADVRPVVLCKDCQNSYEWANVDGDNYRYCGYLRSRWNHDVDRMVDDDDFCKWGKKREES